MAQNFLKNKVILITGASMGIGEADAYEFSKEGANLALTYLSNKKQAEEIKSQCLKLGAKEVVLIQLDITKDISIKKAVAGAIKKFSHIDILINNAGVISRKNLKDQSFDEISSQCRVNLEGLIKMTKAALPHIKEMVVNISSRAGIDAHGGLAPYCATKWGVRGFTKAMADEIKNIQFYVIEPRRTKTRMTNFTGDEVFDVARIIKNVAKGEYELNSGDDVIISDYL